MEGLGAKLTIGELLIRAIAYIIRRKKPVVIQIELFGDRKTERIRIEIRANTVPEAEELFEYVKKQRPVLLN